MRGRESGSLLANAILSRIDDSMSPKRADVSAAPIGAGRFRAVVGHGGQRDGAADRATMERTAARALLEQGLGDGASAFGCGIAQV
jgi:hypothetical protein